jgi:hypothetical protein
MQGELVAQTKKRELENVPESHAFLEGPDPGGFGDLDLIPDAHTGDGQVLIGGGDLVRHFGGLKE